MSLISVYSVLTVATATEVMTDSESGLNLRPNFTDSTGSSRETEYLSRVSQEGGVVNASLTTCICCLEYVWRLGAKHVMSVKFFV